MNDEEEEEKGSISRIAPFSGFSDIAHRNHSAMQDLLKALPKEPKFVSPEEEDEGAKAEYHYWEVEARPVLKSIEENAVITVLMASAAVELYINDAAARLLGQNYSERHFDRIDIVSKWMLLPRLVSKYAPDRESKGIRLLRTLVETRNKLMHPKSKPLKESLFEKRQRDEIEGSVEYLVKAANCSIQAIDELREETKKWDVSGYGNHHLQNSAEKQNSDSGPAVD